MSCRTGRYEYGCATGRRPADARIYRRERSARIYTHALDKGSSWSDPSDHDRMKQRNVVPVPGNIRLSSSGTFGVFYR